MSEEVDFYNKMGGEKNFRELTKRFYENVKQSSVLAPMYPAEDMEGSERRLRMFLEQYWGGPGTYSEERGHPRLRMRHSPFYI